MDGHPERARTVVRLARPAHPRATRSNALRLTVTIVFATVLVAASFARATGSSDSQIGSGDRPVMSDPNQGPDARWLAAFAGCAITWLGRSISDWNIHCASRQIGCAGLILVARRNDAAAARLPVRRRARRRRGL